MPRRNNLGVYTWDARAGVLTWDDTIAHVFEAREGEEPIETWLRRVPQEDVARVRERTDQDGEREITYRVVLDDGSVRKVLTRVIDVEHDESGQPVWIRGILADITEVVRAGTQVAALLDSISDGFYALDRDYRFTYVNRVGEQVLGQRREDLVDRVVWDVFPHARGTLFEVTYRRVMHQRVPEAFEEFYPEPLNRWLEVRVMPSSDGIAIYFQDVTTRHEQHSERERLLDAERRARREAEAAQHAAEKAQSALTHLATHDPLTKLPNRLAFERHAARLLSREAATLLFADVDRFKMLNDSLGHTTGDRFLVETASRISQVLRPGDFAARIGGDEFVVILPGEEAAVAQSVASRLLETLRQPLDVDGSRIQTSASIGVASAPAGSTIDVLLRNADIALYRSKDAGRDRVAWFDLAAHDQLMERTALERDLRSALEHELLQQHYQPAFDLATGRMTGAEALARWQHPTRGWIRPDVFIPIAEDSGLMPELGVAALQTAVLRAIRWRHLPDFTVWVNVSARQLDAPGLADRLLALISNARLEPSRIGVEVTESVFADQGVALTELRRLSDRGMPIAIDDFGTGYSSLSRLIELPIDVLKIDRSFIARAGEQQGLAALSMIVNVADSLGLSTIAEGVETAQQLDLMKNLGVSHAQGFLLGRPVPAEQLLTFDGGQGGLLPA